MLDPAVKVEIYLRIGVYFKFKPNSINTKYKIKTTYNIKLNNNFKINSTYLK